MTNATVTNNNKRLIMRYHLSTKDEARQPRLTLYNATTVASICYRAHPSNA